MRRLLFVLPLLLLAALAIGIGVKLLSGSDPQSLPSALIDKPLPEFSLAALPGRPGNVGADGLASTDFGGTPMLLNVFASWCVPCLAEHPVITKLGREDGIPVAAINYKDKPEDALAWLKRNGDPYRRIGADADGRTAIDLGVYGVPETFVIDKAGRIRYRHPGPLTPDIVDREIRPLLAELAK
ncbi:DsbE family thiol:disulfide interchange protein [Inquilinus limosus]|uniref:DsbE family thiol:disulfide interchange protein n=1 Tax=Inquilinus limosus TaxID=171674 RepID=UPI00041C1F1B|nr:DsbE family thiol:disulfide interchange protein [Inquilinus limosus]